LYFKEKPASNYQRFNILNLIFVQITKQQMELKVRPLDTALEIAKNFIQSVITPPLEEIGGMLADKVKAFRLKNQIKIIQQADELLKTRGVKTKKVSLKVMAPLLEECSLEEDDELQKKWAALLANTVAENSSIKTNIFTSTLKEITTEDAEVFKAIFEHCTIKEQGPAGIVTVHRNRAISPAAFEDYPDIDLIFDNLKRLRLIREIATHGSDRVPVVVSELGLRFMAACS
jgi:hypothetical protein